MFSLLWSEHCGYKHSAQLLKRLPSNGERVLQGPGENAGVIDLGEGEAVAFKVESHNHPSAVEQRPDTVEFPVGETKRAVQRLVGDGGQRAMVSGP